MSKKVVLITAVLSMSLFSNGAHADSDMMKKLGVQKQTTDTLNTRTETYKKELGKTKSGKGYGVYGNSTTEYKNPDGERDTTANEAQGRGSKGVGVYLDF